MWIDKLRLTKPDGDYDSRWGVAVTVRCLWGFGENEYNDFDRCRCANVC